jgi:ornithine cyclodeaminase/alanine dehydrogenase-like protein (mu-crystallin family)
MSIWSEIRVDYIEELENGSTLQYIDAWVTGDDNEEGSSIATIDDLGNISYMDERAKTDESAQEIIQKIKQEKIDAKLIELAKIKEDYGGTSEEYELNFHYPIDDLLIFLSKAKVEGNTHIYPRMATHTNIDCVEIRVYNHRQETIEETLERIIHKQRNDILNVEHHRKYLREYENYVDNHLNLD